MPHATCQRWRISQTIGTRTRSTAPSVTQQKIAWRFLRLQAWPWYPWNLVALSRALQRPFSGEYGPISSHALRKDGKSANAAATTVLCCWDRQKMWNFCCARTSSGADLEILPGQQRSTFCFRGLREQWGQDPSWVGSDQRDEPWRVWHMGLY